MPNASSSQRPMLVLTGGGTAGHVMPHLALLPLLRQLNWRLVYIGSAGIEKRLIDAVNIEYKIIAVGKLRRYFSFENMTDVFKILWGTAQSFMFMLRKRPDLVFSKGGFVSVPVAIAAWVLRIPVVTHESDLTPGLANRIIGMFATKILYSFPDTGKFLPGAKAVHTGSPVRESLYTGNRERGLICCGFSADDPRPVVLVMGGSQGAQRINEVLVSALPELLRSHRIVHLCGKGKSQALALDGFKQIEYADQELPDLLALSDVVVSRAGANTLFELFALRKPMLLIPLGIGSRGDQIDNAKDFAQRNWARVLLEPALTPASLQEAIAGIFGHRSDVIAAMGAAQQQDARELIVGVLRACVRG